MPFGLYTHDWLNFFVFLGGVAANAWNRHVQITNLFSIVEIETSIIILFNLWYSHISSTQTWWRLICIDLTERSNSQIFCNWIALVTISYIKLAVSYLDIIFWIKVCLFRINGRIVALSWLYRWMFSASAINWNHISWEQFASWRKETASMTHTNDK